MYPVLFEVGGVAVYSYGFMIAVGIVAGVSYMAIEGKSQANLSFDQANTLFLLIFLAAVVGGKVFLFFESPSRYTSDLSALFRGAGFVFYGSFLFAVPVMLWFFKRNNLNTLIMLDVMAVTTCLVHMGGRIGCFLAGCCYGKPTNFFAGLSFTDARCVAEPKGVPLHPTQLYEAGYIFLVMLFLLGIRRTKQFDGQLFLLYLMCYAVGRFSIEYFRGDEERGYVFGNVVSHSQLIAIMILVVSLAVYFVLRNRKSRLPI
jgi:phosphatidylglycerol---prolipoprotein diacylglyceryl transferase